MGFKVERIISPKCFPHYYATKAYVCSSASDIQNLPKFGIVGAQLSDEEGSDIENEPCNYGSEAVVTRPFSGYKLSPENEWDKIF